MKSRIEQRALELGFHACKFTTAAPPESAPHLDRWLTEGRHGEMAWLARNAQKRVDPNLVLPGAKSIVTLAAAYDSPSNSPAPNQGVVARYARHADYHDVLAEPLKQLSAYIDQLGGAGTRSLWYVDTGPLLERDLAQRAGLGFVGKHTNLISRELGNWIFLAEILTTLEVEPDVPEKNRCGSCSRCITACPTQAITAPFQLDARRCISYLTIELKGSIPVDLRPAIGNRIYGCDDCQLACPWNRFAPLTRESDFAPRHGLDRATLVELFSWEENEFNEKLAGSPIRRIGHERWLRNIAVTLGNAPSSDEVIGALRSRADHPSELVREHVAWALACHAAKD